MAAPRSQPRVGSSGGRPIRELGRDLRKVATAEVRRVGITLYRQSKVESPVGKPWLWKINKGRKRKAIYWPKGYKPGEFKRSWSYRWLASQLLFILGNPRPYAVKLTHLGHSKQVARPWWVPMIRRTLRELAAQPLSWRKVVTSPGGRVATFGQGG